MQVLLGLVSEILGFMYYIKMEFGVQLNGYRI